MAYRIVLCPNVDCSRYGLEVKVLEIEEEDWDWIRQRDDPFGEAERARQEIVHAKDQRYLNRKRDGG